MSEPTEYQRIPDSQWIAPIVVQAFNEGRFELGAALARLTVQAQRMEKAIPAVGSAPLPIYEDVNRTGTVYAQQHVQTPAAPDVCTDCGGACQGHQREAETPKELPQAPETPLEIEHPVTPTARCRALVNGHECHGVLYWVPAEQVWMHLDPTNGLTHTPFPDR
jgi:hypothetical protein